MSDATIPGGQTAYAGDEDAIRKQVEAAMGETKTLPVWKSEEITSSHFREMVRLTPKTVIDAEGPRGAYVHMAVESVLGGFIAGWLTDGRRLILMREARAELEAALPVLVRLIEVAEKAGV